MNPKEDADVLLNAVLAVAETMLSQHGEGGYRKLNGSIVHVAGASRLRGRVSNPRIDEVLAICYYTGSYWSEAAMIELKVRKFGNSLGVVLPEEVISRLQTKDGDPLFLLEGSEGSYRLSPHDPAFEAKMAKAEDIIGRYRNTLHELAK